MAGLLGSLFGSSNLGPDISQLGNLAGTNMTQGGALYGQGQGIQSMLTPFLTQNLTNPQGFGANTISQMITQAGQGAAGATGAADKTAMDLGARTGNTAAIPSMIAASQKAGAKTTADATNNVMIQNMMQKLSQQSNAASGLSKLFDTDLSASGNAYKNAGDVLGTKLKADQASNTSALGGLSSILGMAQSGGGMLQSLGKMLGMGGPSADAASAMDATIGGSADAAAGLGDAAAGGASDLMDLLAVAI